MKRKKRTGNGMTALLAAGMLLTGTICAEMTGLSEVTPLDTRSLTQAVLVADGDLDSRSYTVDWSQAGRLNTEKIVGTLLLLRQGVLVCIAIRLVSRFYKFCDRPPLDRLLERQKVIQTKLAAKHAKRSNDNLGTPSTSSAKRNNDN